MEKFLTCYGSWGLVAGAANGIGAAFSEALALSKMNLVMADINEKAMNETACRLEKSHGISTRRLVVDLSEEDAWLNRFSVNSGKTGLPSLPAVQDRLLPRLTGPAFPKNTKHRST